MRNLFLTLILSYFFFACSPAKIAVDDADWNAKEELIVKGRNGFFLKEKLSFGEFRTSSVRRSWTKGSNSIVSAPVENSWVEKLNVDFVRRKQTVRFSLTDQAGNESQVTAFSRVRWVDLSVNNDPNSIVNIIGDLLQIGDYGINTYAVQIIEARDQKPWEMVIDNNEAQRNAKSFIGFLAKDKSDYYIISAIYKLRNHRGQAVGIPIGGAVGFEFRKPNGLAVAAVSLIDKGAVYFGDVSSKEKFLLANAAAALLLQQQLDQQG